MWNVRYSARSLLKYGVWLMYGHACPPCVPTAGALKHFPFRIWTLGCPPADLVPERPLLGLQVNTGRIGIPSSVPKYVGSPMLVLIPLAVAVAGNPVYCSPKPKFTEPTAGM